MTYVPDRLARQAAERLGHTRDSVSDHLDAIKRNFRGPVRITVLVRRTEHPDGSQDFVLTDDTLDEAIKALVRRKDTP